MKKIFSTNNQLRDKIYVKRKYHNNLKNQAVIIMQKSARGFVFKRFTLLRIILK